MAVLLQFNIAKQHSVEYLQEVTQLQGDVLRQVLQILLRIKLLVSPGVKGQSGLWYRGPMFIAHVAPCYAVSYLVTPDM